MQSLYDWNGLSMCFKNWCQKTVFAYLIGCHNGNHFELILKNPCWQPIKCANSVFGHQLLKLIERSIQRHNFCTKVTPGKISQFWKMTKRASHFLKLLIIIITIKFYRMGQKIRNCLPVKATCANRRKTAFLVVPQLDLYPNVRSEHFWLMGVN